MSAPPAFRCATAARERADPPLGSAPVARAFLLIEHPGPWRFDALAGLGLPTEIAAELSDAVREAGARPLVVRRPGRRRTHVRRSWCVVRVGGPAVWGTWREEADLRLAVAELRRSGVTGSAAGTPDAHAEPVLLVCAHGVHDTCCAVRGRPVAAALATRWPDATWECSHVGGDRFAANLVVLPDGTYYGNLDSEAALSVVAGHLGGRVDPDHLRGSVRWPPAAQAAVGEIHRRHGPYGADDVTADRVVALRTADGTGRRWRVEVSGPGRRWSVDVAATARAAAVLTCAAARPTASTAYRTVSVDELPDRQQSRFSNEYRPGNTGVDAGTNLG